MFLDDIENYTKQYKRGIKKITLRSSYPKIIKQDNNLKLEQSYGNYSLYFSEKGHLLHSFHKEKTSATKVFYGYDLRHRVVSAVCLSATESILKSISEFVYNEDGKVDYETERTIYHRLGYDVESTQSHFYDGNVHRIHFTKSDDDEFDGRYINTLDQLQRKIEVKITRDDCNELIDWSKFEYDENNYVKKEISFDERGVKHSETNYFYNEKQLITNIIYEGDKFVSKTENIYTYNERGHWITMAVIIDGVPVRYHERIIDYY